MTRTHLTSYERTLVNSFYVGINVENVLYGIQLLLYLKTMRILLSSRGAQKLSNLFYALFSSLMVFSITVWIVTEAIFGHEMWLVDSDFPEGQYTYWKTNLPVWYMEWSRVGMLILQLMTDGLMIYRCRIIWNSNRVIILPVILWLATLVLGIMVVWANSTAVFGIPLGLNVSDAITMASWATSAFLNTTLTCMICYRVVRHGKLIREHLGKEHASFYFTIVTLVIESVFPYTLSSIAFLVSMGTGSATFVGFICVYFMMMCISPQMLILRVASGTAWDSDTFSKPGSTVRFSRGGGETTETDLHNGARDHLQASLNLPVSNEHGKERVVEA